METTFIPTAKKKCLGEYIGVVEEVDDPEEMMRVRVRVKNVFSDSVPVQDLPWATYKLPVGARANDGYFTPCDVGDLVWVDFPFNGDTRRPRITGSVHFCPGEQPDFPHEAFAGPDSLVHKRTGNEPVPAEAEYHRGAVYTQHGVTVEIGEDGSLRTTQRVTGSAIEISPDGHIVVHGERTVYVSAKENHELIIFGDHSEQILGNLSTAAVGTCKISGGNELTIQSSGQINVRAPMVKINS